MNVSRILHWEIMCLLFALLAILAYLVLIGRINLAGLLRWEGKPSQFPLGRIQFLLVTVMVCYFYLTEVMHSTAGRVPDIGNHWLYLFGGSSSLYLVGRVWTSTKR